MRCNACWRELEGRAVSTTCGHLYCNEDASKILSSDAACPICDQVLSKSLMRPVDINPGNEWINMAMAGVSPQILMKSAYRSVMFYIGQQELEMNYKMKKIVGQCKQKCEVMQEKFTEKLEQIQTAYQKMAKRCQMMEQEIESLSKDKQELQEKYAEKSRQKRKLDEMYDQLRSEYESVKRSAIQPANSFFPGAEPELFSGMTNMMVPDDLFVADQSVFTPETPGRREMWPSTKTANLEAFDLSGGSPAKAAPGPVGSGTRRQPRPPFGAAANNPAATTLHDLIISPMKRPQLSRNHARLFT
ncbi:E3 ubiquitin-protein ligase CCNB1IP1 homolog [Musa acuminata AAA Group]|uniref:E3 ubiquitin-protein ligase CCNB1IP1 homolog n=1 Tax=Musa acuminata AAA Group TaxID=214697 RepID=UPI0031E34007